jgi:hypothetical protein
MMVTYKRILGISLIVFSWIIWGIILLLPFFKLSLKQYVIAYPVLLVSTNIFWIGAALLGKELIQKYRLVPKVKTWVKRYFKKREH